MTAEKSSKAVTKRLKILEADEIAAVFGLPIFDDDDRAFYFSLLPPEKALLSQLHGHKSYIYYILQLGYFKAQQQFFVFDQEQVVVDANYVQRTYFPGHTLRDFAISKVTRLKQQRLIMELLNYRTCGEEEWSLLRRKAQQLARISSRPIYIFRELLAYLTRDHIVVPGYTMIQEMIGDVLHREKERLVAIASSQLTTSDAVALNNLLDNPHGLYEITRLKREPKDFSNKEITKEIQHGEQIKPLYAVAQIVLPRLEISNESINYYASMINYYSVFQMNQLEKNLAFIYLLCFVHHRYQRLHDNLINCFMYRVRQLLDEAKSAARERLYEQRLEHTRQLHKAGKVLKLFTDDSIAAATPFEEVRARAFAIIQRENLEKVADHILQTAQWDEKLFQWEYIDQISNRFKLRLRPILRILVFEAATPNNPLVPALKFLKTALQQEKPLTQYKADKIPCRFIPDTSSRYLHAKNPKGEKQLLVDRYEFLVYRSLRNELLSGDIFCQNSVRFRSFEDDLLSDNQWREKDKLIDKAGLPILTQAIDEHLTDLSNLLEMRLAQVNQRISSGENEHIEVKKSGHWRLPYSRADRGMNNPFFESLKQVDIHAVFHFVNRQCQFMSAFTHVLHRYARQKADLRTLTACILAWGTNMGLGRMAQTSDIGYQALTSTSNNFVRMETLQKANASVANAIAQLPIFQQYNLGGVVHSSSDGQKFETLLHTINARYSPKYFGVMKGIVAYTLIANHIPINAKIIGANEHESHYVFDLLYNNPTDFQPDVHSTDTHGANEVNFGILNFFGYRFAPRYRDLYSKVNKALYGFMHPSQYDPDWLLRPIRKINKKLVIEEWENIQRIVVSLALKTTTQSIVIGKLSSYARRNRTKQALWEYDNIIRSLYLLDYIDSLSLRRNVQHALNQGESYHKLHKAVSYANFGRLRFKTEGEQQIWNDCGRLIANCIIYYNSLILSNVLRRQAVDGISLASGPLAKVSPVAWQHINFYGRYEFTKSFQPIDIDEIVQELLSRSETAPKFA